MMLSTADADQGHQASREGDDMNFNELLEYRDGFLFWKKRLEDKFKDPRYCERWNKRWSGRIAGCEVSRKSSSTAYMTVCVNGKKYYQHRVIWEMLKGKIPDGMEIDHQDHNGLNNLIENLRLTSPLGNGQNKPRLKNNTSGYVGVSKSGSKWRAYIGEGNKQIWLGSFDSFDDAKMAREKASSRYSFHCNHGEPSA